MKCWPGVSLILASLGTPAAAHAQVVGYGLDALFANRYVWRGTVHKNGFVLQPDGYLSLRLPPAWLSAGVWSDLELEGGDSRDLTDRAAHSAGFGEITPWLEVTGEASPLDASLGAQFLLHRRLASASGLTPRFNTAELYGRLRFKSMYLAPEFEAWWDVAKVRGFYFEGGVSLPLLANPEGSPFWAAYLSARAGVNAGQGPDAAHPAELANFTGRGLTHVDLAFGVSLRLPRLPASTQLEGHLQFNRDPATRRHSFDPGDDHHRVTLWFGLSTTLPSYAGRAE